MSDAGEILNQYRSISNKLKKKFLRKTNVSDHSDQFVNLALQCERSELHEYAGLAWLGAAKCEASLNHRSEESAALVKAGQHFIQAENKSLISTQQQLLTGLNCINQSNDFLQSNNHTVLASSVYLETVNLLLKSDKLNNISEIHSAELLRNTCKLFENYSYLKSLTLNKLVHILIRLEDYDGALKTLNEIITMENLITTTPFGIHTDILKKCEISRVLLILILRPTVLKMSSDLIEVIDKYSLVSESNDEIKSLIGDELYILLSSLVVSCLDKDIEAVGQFEEELWNYFDEEHQELFRILLKIISNVEN